MDCHHDAMTIQAVKNSYVHVLGRDTDVGNREKTQRERPTMSKGAKNWNPSSQSPSIKQRVRANCTHAKSRTLRPAVAHRQRGQESNSTLPFNAPETWHEAAGNGDKIQFIVEPPGEGYVHPLSIEEVRERIAELPRKFSRQLETVKFSRMTKKRALFPCYGMQWGSAVYLYPIETSYQEVYTRPPTPQQQIDAKMYGGEWQKDGRWWILKWTPETIRDFYLNSVLIHEIGHVHDDRNTRFQDRERYADWFAIEYGYRASRRLR